LIRSADPDAFTMTSPADQSNPRPQSSDRDIYVIARLHRFMLLLGVAQAVLGLAYLFAFKLVLDPSPWFDRLGFQLLIGMSLALCLCSAASTLKVGRLMHAEFTMLYTVAGGVPFIGTVLVFTLDTEIREYLSSHGLKVGILGVSSEDAEKLIA
jgi:hypothetical protein